MYEFRREEPMDRDDVYRIHQDAFQRKDEAELVDKLRTNEQFDPKLSFVAIVNKKIVGHVLFTPILINSKSYSTLALAPISISSEYQRQGFAAIIVLGHEHFYPRFGFLPAKKFRIRPSFPLENENCFMVLELKPQALTIDDQEGVVQYLPEFGI